METASLQRMARKMKLLNWGFNCICDICNLKDKALEENENLRTKLQSAKIALQKCPTDPFNITSLKKQMVIEKLIIQLLRELSTQKIGMYVSCKSIFKPLSQISLLLKCRNYTILLPDIKVHKILTHDPPVSAAFSCPTDYLSLKMTTE